jgi:hypothetical protein
MVHQPRRATGTRCGQDSPAREARAEVDRVLTDHKMGSAMDGVKPRGVQNEAQRNSRTDS